jgi:uncharacterized protein/very-short-patch-repair endonuclease
MSKKGKKSIPEHLFDEFHPTLNANKKLEDYSGGSKQKVWWLCEETFECGCEHAWESIISNRVKGSGCPYCNGKSSSFCIHQSLLHTHPEIADQWHPTLNNDLKPENFTSGSNKKVWFLCKKSKCGCEHEWESKICHRTNGSGCPYCSFSRKQFCIHDSLLYTHPEIAKQWHPTKNGDLKPENFTCGSGEKIWWKCNQSKCECVHEWKTTIDKRVNDRNCPYCCIIKKQFCIHQSLLYTHPEISKQWHPNKNGDLKPENFTSGSNEIISWLCDKTCEYGCKHEWKTTINSRTSGSDCPYCDGNNKHCIHQSLLYTHPEIVDQWHPTKNKNLKPENFTYGSGKKVWWLCKNTCDYGCKHEWKTSISGRCRKTDCPFCQKFTKSFCIHQSLLHTHPEISKLWHPTKNKNLKPKNFTFGSNKKVFWLCDKNKNHEWKTTINHKTSGKNCPHCKNKTESILYDFLNKHFDNVERQFKSDWCKNILTNNYLPFDFYVEKFKLIIELDGRQHFNQVSTWESPENIQKRDKYKMDRALENRISIIRLLQEDVYLNKYDWKEKLLKVIKLYDKEKIIYLCENNEYYLYKQNLENIRINEEDLKDIDLYSDNDEDEDNENGEDSEDDISDNENGEDSKDDISDNENNQDSKDDISDIEDDILNNSNNSYNEDKKIVEKKKPKIIFENNSNNQDKKIVEKKKPKIIFENNSNDEDTKIIKNKKPKIIFENNSDDEDKKIVEKKKHKIIYVK